MNEKAEMKPMEMRSSAAPHMSAMARLKMDISEVIAGTVLTVWLNITLLTGYMA